MGTPIPEPAPPSPVPPGEDCPVCWGIGKEFGNVATPESVEVEFDGIAKGPDWEPSDGDPPEGSFTLGQSLVFGPCTFFLLGELDIELSFDPTRTILNASKVGGFDFFHVLHDEICTTILSSSLDKHFTGGTATVTIPEIN